MPLELEQAFHVVYSPTHPVCTMFAHATQLTGRMGVASSNTLVCRIEEARRPVPIRDRWVLGALHGHFMFATGFLLRDQVVTGGEAIPWVLGMGSVGMVICVGIEYFGWSILNFKSSAPEIERVTDTIYIY